MPSLHDALTKCSTLSDLNSHASIQSLKLALAGSTPVRLGKGEATELSVRCSVRVLGDPFEDESLGVLSEAEQRFYEAVVTTKDARTGDERRKPEIAGNGRLGVGKAEFEGEGSAEDAEKTGNGPPGVGKADFEGEGSAEDAEKTGNGPPGVGKAEFEGEGNAGDAEKTGNGLLGVEEAEFEGECNAEDAEKTGNGPRGAGKAEFEGEDNAEDAEKTGNDRGGSLGNGRRGGTVGLLNVDNDDVGLNPGNGLAASEKGNGLTSTNQCAVWLVPGTEHTASLPSQHQSLLICLAFNVHPEQGKWEHVWKINPSRLFNLVGNSKEPILANACLQKWRADSKCALIGRTYNAGGTVKLVLAPMEPWDRTTTFRYSPSYLELLGLDDFNMPNENIALEQRKALAIKMLNTFYESVDQLDYMMDDELRANLDPRLTKHLLHGIRGQQEGFAANQLGVAAVDRLGFFLTGPPGVGKSTFVSVFSTSLKMAIRSRVDPNSDVHVVKIPLNAMTPQTLTHVLCIQGISDWSVERVMEQCLTKGNSVILHLEECPEDLDLQTRLFACVERMLSKLYARYPDYRSNVLFLFTSNHNPCAKISEFTTVVHVRAPSPQAQRKWLVRKMEAKLNRKVTIDSDAFPLAHDQGDIRPLNAWWLSLSHGFLKIMPNYSPNHELYVYRQDAQSLKLVVRDPKRAAGIFDETAVLTTSDGFFHYDALGKKEASGGFQSINEYKKAVTISEMALSGFLTPTVFVLRGRRPWQELMSSMLLDQFKSMLKERSSGRRVSSTTIELLETSDEPKVMGDPSEIRGGLYRFIDDVTNPNANKRKRDDADRSPRSPRGGFGDVCVVLALVNEIGSVLLRELLEAGDKSRTHRLGISKTGLIFIVSLVEGSKTTPQLESRAHHILDE